MPALTVRLTGSIEQRLTALALKSGRSKNVLGREAILAFIDELENVHLAEMRARKNRKTLTLDDTERQLGLHR